MLYNGKMKCVDRASSAYGEESPLPRRGGVAFCCPDPDVANVFSLERIEPDKAQKT